MKKTPADLYPDRLHVFAQIMRDRFPAANFKSMLRNANLETILDCLKSTPIAAITGYDVQTFRSMLEQLANMPPPLKPPQDDKPKPGRLERKRIASQINETGLMLFGRHITACATPTAKPHRQRSRNILNLDRTPVCRQVSHQVDN